MKCFDRLAPCELLREALKTYRKGVPVDVVSGPMAGPRGTVDAYDPLRGVLSCTLPVFGKHVPVELPSSCVSIPDDGDVPLPELSPGDVSSVGRLVRLIVQENGAPMAWGRILCALTMCDGKLAEVQEAIFTPQVLEACRLRRLSHSVMPFYVCSERTGDPDHEIVDGIVGILNEQPRARNGRRMMVSVPAMVEMFHPGRGGDRRLIKMFKQAMELVVQACDVEFANDGYRLKD